MTESTLSSGDQYAHLRANAAAQKQTTVDRLSQAIRLLEAEGRPVNTFTIKEVSGLDYMAYYRNREAFQLFQEHSMHLRKEREQEQAKRQAASRVSKKKRGKEREAPHTVKVASRDPLLDYKRPRLVELLYGFANRHTTCFGFYGLLYWQRIICLTADSYYTRPALNATRLDNKRRWSGLS